MNAWNIRASPRNRLSIRRANELSTLWWMKQLYLLSFIAPRPDYFCLIINGKAPSPLCFHRNTNKRGAEDSQDTHNLSHVLKSSWKVFEARRSGSLLARSKKLSTFLGPDADTSKWSDHKGVVIKSNRIRAHQSKHRFLASRNSEMNLEWCPLSTLSERHEQRDREFVVSCEIYDSCNYFVNESESFRSKHRKIQMQIVEFASRLIMFYK